MRQTNLEAARATSPCVGICQLDAASGYCLGCARTGVEIGGWAGMSDDERQAVLDALPQRWAALGQHPPGSC
ncbi:MAG: DUF1289 domain-containing protein [Alphaproteobacteria bacterium]|nr:DUF1289 domain-containing protein [Alphaproteobacteria bacterium]